MAFAPREHVRLVNLRHRPEITRFFREGTRGVIDGPDGSGRWLVSFPDTNYASAVFSVPAECLALADFQPELAEHPDPWMDNEPGSMTFPEHWAGYTALPPREALVGPVEASWEEIDPGVALIRVQGGTLDDRLFVHHLWRVALASHGIEHAQFGVGDDDEFRKTAHWRDLMAKAKRLIDSGQVQILRNTRNVVAAHVVGDHGEYNCEFKRDDPESWSITGWDCECPWSQYAWQRTRKWKKYEGRVCSHVLAAFWYARRHPMDEDSAPDGGPQRGMKGWTPDGAPAPDSPPPAFSGPGDAPGTQQQLFGPDVGQGQFTDMTQPGPGAMPGTMPGGETMPASGAPEPMAPPGADIIPPQPMLPGMDMMQPYVPGSTPNGVQAPPNAVSVPGARMPTPHNPGQYPGGTYSKMAAHRLWWRPGDFGRGLITPDGTVYTWPEEEMEHDQRALALGLAPAECRHFGIHPHGQVFATGHVDDDRFAQDTIAMAEEAMRRHAAQAGFENGQKVRLLTSEYGIAEGKSEEHGSGQYREVPQGTHGEVLGQDQTTGWVEVIFPLDTSGPMEPYHVRSFVEPKSLQIVEHPPGSPFIKRVGPHSM